MSEKRFSKLSSSIDYFDVWDSVEEKGYTLEEVCEKLNEQQATIKRLQDLCGKSDGENTKLRIENKTLQEENEQLRKQLDFYLLDEFEWKEKYGDDGE